MQRMSIVPGPDLKTDPAQEACVYLRTLDGAELGWIPTIPSKWPQRELRKRFVSKVVTYKDSAGNFQSTKYSIYVPGKVRNPFQMDLLIFFHGLIPVCDSEHNDPNRIIKGFRLDVQVDSDPQLALVAPIVLWNKKDRSEGIIKAAWSPAKLNAFVEEALDQIGTANGVRPQLGRLILVGHSAAYDILTPLAEQFDRGAAETKTGALAKLERVVAMDTTYRERDAEALEKWARNLTNAVFNLVQSKSDGSVAVWQNWLKARIAAGHNLPNNLRVFHNVAVDHCHLPTNFLTTYNYSSP